MSSVLRVAQKYDIDLCLALSHSKFEWKSRVKSAVVTTATRIWNSKRSLCSSLARHYNQVKLLPGRESFLSSPKGRAARLVLKLRLSCSALYGCIRKYDGIVYEDRLCPLCAIEVESSHHMCSACPILSDVRELHQRSIFKITGPLPPCDWTLLLLQYPLPTLHVLTVEQRTSLQVLTLDALEEIYNFRNFKLHTL